jgi:hypothetical protein
VAPSTGCPLSHAGGEVGAFVILVLAARW